MSVKSLPSLSISRETALNKLKVKINEGQKLLEKNIVDEESLNSAENDYDTWQNLVYDTLDNIFEDTSTGDEFIEKLGAVLNNRAGLRDKIDWFEKDVKNDVHKLQAIIERLENIPEKKSGNTVSDSPLALNTGSLIKSEKEINKPWYEKPVGLIIIGVVVIILGAIVLNLLHLK